MEDLKLVEFYAGVGGWHMAVKLSRLHITIVAAVDINTTANAVYKHNFPTTRHLQRNICGLSAKDLDAFGADIFTLSPPCQPFTRQGKKADSNDHRTDSFFHLMHTIREMTSPPRYLMVENVLGFEASHTRQCLVDMVTVMGYTHQEFLLSPRQFGVPNSRLRYYLLAKHRTLQFPHPTSSGVPCRDAVPLLKFMPLFHPKELCNQAILCGSNPSAKEEGMKRCVPAPGPLCEELEEEREEEVKAEEHGDSIGAVSRKEVLQGGSGFDKQATITVRPLLDFLQEEILEEELQRFLVPDKVLQKYAMALDIVQPSSTSSCCFTKGYFHYAVGTGSVIQHAHTEDLHVAYKQYNERQKDGDMDGCVTSLKSLQLRYFTPREVANLMCFPTQFSLPDELTAGQCYRVVGNSVNVLVVASLLRYLLLPARLAVENHTL